MYFIAGRSAAALFLAGAGGSELAFFQASSKLRIRQDIVATGLADVGRAQDYVDALYSDMYRALDPGE